MKIVDAADTTYRNLDESSLVSIPSITAWYRNNVGRLNNLINRDFSVDSNSLELVDSSGQEMGAEEYAVFEKVYMLGFYDRLVRTNLGVSSVDIVSEVQSDGAVVRMLNRNNVAQTYIQVRKELRDELKQLLNGYKIKAYRPLQVVGDDMFTYRDSIFELSDDRNG